MKDLKNQPIVIRTPDHRLRVFVSSTLKELAEERQAIRQAILKLRLVPIMFESGARPHPAQQLYQAYLSQSHIFIGVYWQGYGRIAPGMQLSGLEDEYNLSETKPRLLYIKNPAPNREPALTGMLDRIRKESSTSYKYFTSPDELRELVENDLALLLTEYFETARSEEQMPGDSAQHASTNVPIPRNPLIGREQELRSACDLLLRDDVALVTLTGPGGTGKSRLGIQVALALSDHFQDGVYMVELESVEDPNLVIPTIARTLGVTEVAGGPPLIESLEKFLCGKQVLLLLDNFEQVVAAAPKVAGLLEGCPRAKMLVTSRAPLHLRAEKELPIPPLAVPPLGQAPDLLPLSQYSAVQLFIQRAQGVKPDFQVTNENAPAVAEICHRLDGLPLAIELAAARIRLLSPHMLLARLEHCFQVLRGGTRDLPERQRTLYSAIDWSYNLLNEDQRRLLRRLSVFVGGWTFEAAEAVCNDEGEQQMQVWDGLENLIDNSLLQPPDEVAGEPRLRMLETIREFAHERLTDSGEADAVLDRHAQYYMSLAKQAEQELQRSAQSAWHVRLEAELDNLRAAMGWTMEHSQYTCELRIATALWRFWWTHGYWREGLQWVKKGLAGAGAIPDALRAKALTQAGWLTRDLGDYAQGIAMLQESLALWRQIKDQSGIALTLDILGTTVMRQGDYPEATVMLQEAYQLSRQLGDPLHTYDTLSKLGLAAAENGDSQRAIEIYAESLALARAAGDDHHVAKILNNLGAVYTYLGDYDRAMACYAEAMPIYQKLGARASAAIACANRGVVALKLGDFAQAFDLLVQAIVTLQKFGDKTYPILYMEPIAFIAKEQNLADHAARLLSASESLRKAIGLGRTPVDQAEYDTCLASVRSQLGEAAFATAWAEGGKMTFEQALAYAVNGSDQARSLSLTASSAMV
jgi:predicted ATPase/Tfp pilus assembly protein PilF